jgi:phosphodiesterase/alkaline phosphatase D-like protein
MGAWEEPMTVGSKWSALVAAVLVLANAPAPAHESLNTLVAPGLQQYAPAAAPDRVSLVATADPSTSQTVTWRTNAGVTESVAQIARAVPTPGLHLAARDAVGRIVPLRTDNGLAHHHSVTFEGLEPDTLYAYRVRGQHTWSEWFQFRTAGGEFQPFSFLYFGDAQNSIRSHFSRVIREAFMAEERPALMLHAGDLVNSREGNHDDEWGEWFHAGGFLPAMVASIPVAGNHEFISVVRDDGTQQRELSPAWEAHFKVPANGPPELRRTVYYLEYQDVLFVALDSMSALQDDRLAAVQAEWLDQVLGRAQHRWVVVSHHHPLHSVSRGRDNPTLRALWQPVYQRHGVDLVLQGHDHTYGRGSNVPAGTTAVDAAVGTIYVVSVAGPKMYLVSEQARAEMDRVGEELQLYQVVRVEADRLHYESKTVTGDVYDAFELQRQPDGTKRLVELTPVPRAESRCSNPQPPRPDRCWNGTELVQ